MTSVTGLCKANYYPIFQEALVLNPLVCSTMAPIGPVSVNKGVFGLLLLTSNHNHLLPFMVNF